LTLKWNRPVRSMCFELAESRNAVPTNSATARRITATLTLCLIGADESAEELFIHLGSDRIHINASLSKELTRIFDVIDAGGLDGSVYESCAFKFLKVFAFFKSAGDAADPEQHAFAHLLRHASANNYIGDGEPAPGA